MSNTSTVASKQLDYGFLLLTHIVCADQQIHSEESKYLKELAERANISSQTKDEMEKIFAQDDHHLMVDYIAKQVSVGQRSEVMRQILAMAHVDGDFTCFKKELINKVGKIWYWSEEEINWNRQYAEKFARSRKAKIKQDTLLAGKAYNQAIKQCAKIAQEDYKYAELAFNKTEATLNTLILSLEEVILKIENKNSKATTAKEVAKQLEDSKQSLDTEIIKKLAKVKESHKAKERALNYFSIAFLGRTKAGKSTLHSIITQDGWDSIGVGKQRTTRFNRIYEWKNIRIIDTPGIGAADSGGRKDEEIAKSIVDEADVICYVVTNDSIQESEFQFLKLLKEQAKPLIILLNIKYNLRDSRRLQHFLKNPNKLFTLEGKSGIGGHINRIRRYANQYYANDYFPIVTVMLLAAQLSSEAEHQENKDKLYQASRIQDFLDSIQESLIKYGTIRRSQTFLGSTVGSVQKPNNWVISQKQNYQQLIYTLKNKRQTIHRDIHKAQTDALEFQHQQIEAVFRDAFNAIQDFAEKYWNEKDENRLNTKWKQKLNQIKFEQRIKNSCEEAAKHFNEQVKESLEEIGKELQLIAQLKSSNFSFKSQDSFDTQKLFTIGGLVLSVVGGFIFQPLIPIGVLLGIIGHFGDRIGGWFQSREQKRLEAVAKISSSLDRQLKKEKVTILQQTNNNFDKYCFNISENINQYFAELIQGLEAISSEIEKAQKSLDATANYLNYGYAKRIIDWATEQDDTLTITTAKRTIDKVQRKFGQSIDIKTKTTVEMKKSCDEIKQVLQEDISITTIN